MRFHVYIGKDLNTYRSTLDKSLGKLDLPDFIIDAPEISVMDSGAVACVELGKDLKALVLWD